MKEQQYPADPANSGEPVEYLKKLLTVLESLREGELRLIDLPVDSELKIRIHSVLRELVRKRFGEEAKANFLANISHEIRTPLNSILGFTDILVDPAVAMEDKLKGAEIVRRNGLELLETVDEILDITNAESGRLKTDKVETALPQLLADLEIKWRSEARKKNIDLSFDLGQNLPRRVITDPERLRQILSNVIGNAIKFTGHGTVRVTAALNLTGSRPMLHFEISDTGVGIDANWFERIFTPFSQADASSTRLNGGTGVGLALSRSLARALGGDVRLTHSERGAGSSFQIDVQVELPASEEWAQAERAPASGGGAVLQGRRILLVEDLEDNQFLITQFLTRAGANVEIAGNGEEGVEKALNGQFEVVLMDIQMPKLDGYQATARLRSAGYEKPIIALTAHALLEEREKCLRIGCDGHLTKPINRQRLIETLASAINRI